jgi:DNA-binding MurR/RpiR family transcriptional regulator
MLKDEYIFQEMLEQGKIAALHKTLPRPKWPPVAEHIILTGSGDSYCAALFGQWVLAEKGNVSALPALEASQAACSLHSEDLLITVSVSGRTARVLEAAQRAVAQGAHVVAVTDNVNSPLAVLASEIWPICASPCEELFETS